MAFLTIVHIIVAIVLILLVLVQDSQGAMGGAFGGGGGSNTLLGAGGADNVLSKLTKGVVIVFAISCILLTRFSSQNRESVLDLEGTQATIPTEPVAPAGPGSNTEETQPSN